MTGILKRLFSSKSGNSKDKSSPPDKQKSIKQSDTVTSKKVGNKQVRILKRDAHTVSRKKISHNALKVLYRLNEAGYQAYLVGGGVRDILLGLQPKDFDVATDATPEQVYSLFRNCRLIGRRFRLAHILYGREVIEVATFRAGHEQNEDSSNNDSNNYRTKTNTHHKNDQSRTSDQGMLMRDNVYGSMEDDAFRRDFTVNALYYTVSDFSVVDYTNGLQDLAERKLRLIGEPNERYREDPVRILRAIRLSCKLNLTIEANTAAPIKTLAELLSHVSSARLWDECNKMLLAGHAESTWNLLKKYGVSDYLFSQTIYCLNKQDQSAQEFASFINAALKSTDTRIAEKKPVTPAFLFAVFLWQPMQDYTKKLIAKGIPAYEANQKASSKIMDMQRQAIGIPKRFSMMAKEMWSLQFRLTNLRKKSVTSLISHARFRAAYDFLCLRAGNNSDLINLAQWWTDYQDANQQIRNQMLNEAISNQPKKRRKTKKKPTKRLSKQPPTSSKTQSNPN